MIDTLMILPLFLHSFLSTLQHFCLFCHFCHFCLCQILFHFSSVLMTVLMTSSSSLLRLSLVPVSCQILFLFPLNPCKCQQVKNQYFYHYVKGAYNFIPAILKKAFIFQNAKTYIFIFVQQTTFDATTQCLYSKLQASVSSICFLCKILLYCIVSYCIVYFIISSYERMNKVKIKHVKALI